MRRTIRYLLVSLLIVLSCPVFARAALTLQWRGKGDDTWKTCSDRASLPASMRADLEWRVEGRLRENQALVDWAPNYVLSLMPAEDRSAESRPLCVSLALPLFRRGLPKGMLSAVAAMAPSAEALRVNLWLIGDQVHATQVCLDEEARLRMDAQDFDLPLDLMQGHLVRLFWTDGQFVSLQAPSEQSWLPACMEACAQGDLALLQASFMEKPESNEYGLLLFEVAANAGSVDCATWLLSRQNAKPGKVPASLLLGAAERGRTSLFKGLFDAGYRIAEAKDGEASPLGLAATHGFLDLVELLLSNKANVDHTDNMRATPLGLAIDNGHADIARLFLKRGQRMEFASEYMKRVFLFHCAEGSVGMVRLFLEKGCKAQEVIGHSFPLLAAAGGGQVATIETLLSKGADLQVVDRNRMGPVMHAVLNGRHEALRVLLKAGAPVDLQTDKGSTALHMSVLKDDAQATRILLDAGANPLLADKEGRTALALALLSRARKVADVLAVPGFVYTANSASMDPLIEAALCMDIVGVIDTALKAGWSPETRVRQEWPALRVARLCRAERCIAVLKEAGASEEKSLEGTKVFSKVLDRPLKVARAMGAEDPRDIWSSFSETRVLVDALVDVDGRLLFLAVANEVDVALARAALNSIQAWTMEPPLFKGAPATTQVRIPVLFPASFERAYSVGGLMRKPKVISQQVPQYPYEARVRGGTGMVLLRFIVMEDGSVAHAQVEQTSNDIFVKPALSAVRTWRFEPGLMQGKPVKVRMRVPISFELN